MGLRDVNLTVQVGLSAVEVEIADRDIAVVPAQAGIDSFAHHAVHAVSELMSTVPSTPRDTGEWTRRQWLRGQEVRVLLGQCDEEWLVCGPAKGDELETYTSDIQTYVNSHKTTVASSATRPL